MIFSLLNQLQLLLWIVSLVLPFDLLSNISKRLFYLFSMIKKPDKGRALFATSVSVGIIKPKHLLSSTGLPFFHQIYLAKSLTSYFSGWPLDVVTYIVFKYLPF